MPGALIAIYDAPEKLGFPSGFVWYIAAVICDIFLEAGQVLRRAGHKGIFEPAVAMG